MWSKSLKKCMENFNKEKLKNTRASDEVIMELVEALECVSEDGYVMASMPIGNRNRLLKALTKAKEYMEK